MSYISHELKTEIHGALLERQYVDQLEDRPIQAGDRVVVCAHDQRMFLENTWLVMECTCPCGSRKTLSELDVLHPQEPVYTTVDAVYEHSEAPIIVDLTQQREQGLSVQITKIAVILSSVILALTLVCLIIFQYASENSKTQPNEKPKTDVEVTLISDQEEEKDKHREEEIESDGNNQNVPVVPMEGVENIITNTTNIKEDDGQHEAVVSEVKRHEVIPKFKFRNEQYQFRDSFSKKNRDVYAHIDFEVYGKHRGVIHVLFYEPGGKPVLKGNSREYYRTHLSKDVLTNGIVLPLQRQSAFWPLGTYSIEVWLLPTDSNRDRMMLGNAKFDVVW